MVSNDLIGIIGVLSALVLIAIRVPIGVALGLSSFLGIMAITNAGAAWGIISTVPFNFIGNWSLSAAPMFLLMGYICTATGMTEGLFKAMRIFLYKLPGGLAIASVGACALFASASGSSTATSAAMSRIAVPEMLKYKYNPGLASGVIAASGTLGSLIPPSILMVLFGVFAHVSIGKLFVAGIIPGLLSAFLYAAMIYIRVKINPSLAPVMDDTKFTRSEKIDAVKNIWPLPVLITCVMGGIFLGIFTPTEAGAVGATFSLIIAWSRKGLSMDKLKDALVQTASSTASIFIILIGTVILTRFMALSGLPNSLAEFLMSISNSPYMVILSIAILYVILGMFVDSIGLLLLTLPLILPMVHSAGMDLIWFGIIVIKLLEIGLVTPPVGLNVYVIKGALGKLVSLPEIFRGVSWFILTDIICLLILVLIPALSLYLPNIMFN
jgi:tripartite ATP-independent transporter DctM subunit